MTMDAKAAEAQQWPNGTRISKFFEAYGEYYGGTVESYEDGLYYIKYDDGDAEDLDANEMKSVVVAVDSNKENRSKRKQATNNDSKPKQSEDDKDKETVSARGRRRTTVKSYADMDDVAISLLSSEGEEEEEQPPAKRSKPSRSSSSSTRPKKKQRRISVEEDDDDSVFEAGGSDSEDSDLTLDASDDEIPKKPTRKLAPIFTMFKGSKSPKAPKVAKTSVKAPKASGGGGGGKSMAESFKPIDTPLYWTKSLKEIHDEHEYLDPCGMEATDDVIDHLVGEQVLKIGALLQRAIETDPTALGSKQRPLELGTACSGTDAPALAMTIVQEQMERFQFPMELNYQHKFSCEKEPFKQSYLARNFDSILYPDIVKLTDRKPQDRLDIEDKGCSGETFLSAVELLFQEQPDFCIFENVIGAPWAKMQEYITGRVSLATVNDTTKAIQKVSAKDTKIKELTFGLESDGTIRVIEVPMQVGVQCGAKVAGFAKPGDRDVKAATWPSKKKTCTLTELIKHNKANSKADTLVLQTSCTYCTAIQKVDTKDFGLPQTRNRTYMFVWKPDTKDDYDDDLGIYWQSVVTFLKSPTRHSLDAFILDTDHDNIRVFREALNGPPGRHTKRSVFQEPDFFTSGNANVKHNKIAREKLGIEEMARPNVNGGARGQKQIPPHYWLEYIDTLQQREIDMLDILHISAARDAETHDSNFSSFFWNISQNVSKEKHRSAVPGIAGCISPGGEFFVTNLGRPLLGCEKLLVQGIPYFRLALGSESEVELGDLAGNAMSLTVVCATMLAAIACRQLRNEYHGDANIEAIHKFLHKKAALRRPNSVMIPPSAPSFDHLDDAVPIFQSLAALAPEAIKTSVWCTCETSGRNSNSCDFMQCQTCRISCCSNCLGSHAGYQMKSHSIQATVLSVEEHNLGRFLFKLHKTAPSSITFNQKGMEFLVGVNGNKDIHRVGDLWKFVFNLQKVHRHRRKWVLHYNARDNNGVGEVVAEFRIIVGELHTEILDTGDVAAGMRGELISYLPAKTSPLVPGKLEPCAVVVCHNGSLEWMARARSESVSVKVQGKKPKPSLRIELGLTDLAESNLRAASKGAQKKHFLNAQMRGEQHRWLYPRQWKEWPHIISVDSPSFDTVSGNYVRASCRQTVNQSALWIRQRKDHKPPLYLTMKPNVGRTGPDVAIISSSIDFNDFSAILLTFGTKWQPSDSFLENKVKQEAKKSVWIPAPSMGCSMPKSSIEVTGKTVLPSFLEVTGLSKTQISMLYPFESGSQQQSTIQLNVHSGVEAQKIIRAFNYLCVPPITRHVAHSDDLALALSTQAEWIKLLRAEGQPMFGYCDKTIPSRPLEKWVHDKEREVWTRKSSPEESRQYYKCLKEAPKAFQFTLDRMIGSLNIQCFPEVAAHHAARFLVEGRNASHVSEDLNLVYRLSDIAQQSDPEYSPFKVYPCRDEAPLDVKLKMPLYERQQKVVSKMSMIEQGKMTYEEIEMSEHEMPGSTGFSLIAKASRNRQISGGVIADAIGAGKTVISIAMIVKGLNDARAARSYPRQSSATAVVVPSALVAQWKDEIEKFTTGLKVLCIHDTKVLASTTVQKIIEADVVIFPVDIIESKGYTKNLASKSDLSKEGTEIPELPRSMGHAEKPGAKGVWIPATSRDPYGIGSANEMKNQKLRDISAYFTYSYLHAVDNLRQKTFKKSDKGVPLEYFEWERIVVDEIHECLCTEKDNLQLDWFKEKNRRASRELLGITQKNVTQRPLVYRKAIYGLTGTPLLDNSNRVIELANLIGCTYIIGLASHWRKLERESRRDIFLQHFLEPKQSREIRKAIYSKCQEYLRIACCRNTTEKELEGIEKVERTIAVRMTAEEEVEYIQSQHGIDRNKRGLGVRPENFDPSAGHDISKFLMKNADLPSRGQALVDTCNKILSEKPGTKIVVFTDGRIGAGNCARKYLQECGLGCTWLGMDDSVKVQNEKISFYQRPDATEEDRKRPRVLVLHFDHAAGLNLQKECSDMILYNPLYVGDGGITGDPVADASTEQQAIGRVFRPGQLCPEVNVFRIEVQGANGEECLDGYLIRRNTEEQTLAATTNAGEA